MKKIAPSILSADFSVLGEEIRKVEAAGADYIHIDVMDGHFVPNITMGPLVVKAARKITNLPLDVHLMISDPDSFIDDFAAAGASIITVHAETLPHVHRTIEHIKEQKVRAGLALNPATPLDILEYVLPDLDMVLLMTVNPGFERQKFIRAVVPKIRKLRETLDQHRYKVELQVDGGISPDTIQEASSAGADVFVAGSAIFYSEDYGKTIRLMRERM
ncbi:MAG TPA: ribulose-phosphate 3-epimerase [Deltaproteobacteria bacterium]|nr:ribulose-phosphate 3-epimerase [Deltaproteobacteria bacterium]HIJ37107.1 ribulose-phosphate 3-epimerase [Deltaproteobacteria bacterium]HIJ41692.1 ribulose-phosphate 3-epimerase [Deltaproteobacteria bacterium]